MPELNKMDAIKAKLDTIMNRLKNQERRSHNVNEVGFMQGEDADYEVAREGAYYLKECNYLNERRSYHLNQTLIYQPTTHLC